jgi:hypothetical protein
MGEKAYSGPLSDIGESIWLMMARLFDGQGGVHSAMCRLSLPMSLRLWHENLRLRPELRELAGAMHDMHWMVGPDGAPAGISDDEHWCGDWSPETERVYGCPPSISTRCRMAVAACCACLCGESEET